MAKPLTFHIGSSEYSLEPLKLDRKKLYGWSEKIALDKNGEVCNAVSLYSEESMILPKGSIGLGSLSEDGQWVEKSDMHYVDVDGNEASLVPSSFSAPIILEEKVSIETFLEHNITAVYSLQGEENHPDFVKVIQDEDKIYTFEFNYRADYEGDPAFVIENGGELFILVGKKIKFEMIGLNDEGMLDEVEDEFSEDEEDEFDFSMM
jgi:hypothetical protein